MAGFILIPWLHFQSALPMIRPPISTLGSESLATWSNWFVIRIRESKLAAHTVARLDAEREGGEKYILKMM